MFQHAIRLRGFALTLAAVLVSSTLCRTAACGEPPAALQDRIAAIRKENEELEAAFRKELSAAKGDREKVLKANADYSAAKSGMAERLRALIDDNGKDAAIFEAFVVVLNEVRHPLRKEDVRVLLDHHFTHPKLGRLFTSITYRGHEPAKRILDMAAEKHPDREVRGQATFALGETHRHLAFPWGRELPEAEKSVVLDKARHHYERAVAEYADVPSPDGKFTLGEKARDELTRIKNLPNLVVGGVAPPIVGEDLEGKPLRLEDYRGKVVLLVFWGSWCGPCMAMVPHERGLFERYRNKPFVLLGVNCGDTREKAQATVEEKQMAWRHWWDGEQIRGPIETHYNVPHWPRVFVIDAKGVIRAIDPEEKELDDLIKTALEGIRA